MSLIKSTEFVSHTPDHLSSRHCSLTVNYIIDHLVQAMIDHGIKLIMHGFKFHRLECFDNYAKFPSHLFV